MSNFTIEVDAEKIAADLKKKTDEIKQRLQQSVQGLATAAHGRILEQAGEKLKSLATKYRDAVSFEQVNENLFVVTLDQSAMWMEEGVKEPWSMYDALATSKKAKISKDGNKYLVIPFEHSKSPSQQSTPQQNITNEVKSFLKSQKVPFKKIERDETGSPRLGKLHHFDIKSVGANSPRPSSKAKFPTLAGLTIYQRKTPTGAVRRDVMTFRVVSSKTSSDGRWEYKPRDGANIFEDTHKWASDIWVREILPALIESLK